MIKKG